MQFRYVGLIICILSSTVFAQGRKPAVEDFVGIEVEQTSAQQAASASANLYNLENDMKQVQLVTTKPNLNRPILKAPESIQNQAWPLPAVVGLVVLLGLPLLSWFFMMNHLRNKASEESATNIKILETYRKERQLSQKNKDKDDIKRAS